MIIDEEDHLAHYGILRRSGRYPWGSGGTQNSINKKFLDYVEDMKRQGLSEVEIAAGVGITTTELRAAKSIAKNQQKQQNIGMAERLKAKGMSNGAIAERMGLPGESSVRALLADGAKDKADILTSTVNMLKAQVAEKKYVDVGLGAETQTKVTRDKLNIAIAMLKEEGYQVHPVNIRQLGTDLDTRFKVLTGPGVTQKEVWTNRFNIKQISAQSDDAGLSFTTPKPPISISPNRLAVRYAEDGGAKADGVIYVRPGKDDLSLGGKSYAQVRIKVGDKHYLKGMAMYKDDLPDGVDLLFNTNKSKADAPNKLDALKKLTDDPLLPFESVVRQIVDKPGPEGKPISAMNLVNEQGDWKNWKDSISSQILSKQSPALAKEQLDMTYERRKEELNSIMQLTNPTVKKHLLEKFAESADSAAVHLRAAGLPRQAWHVILPFETMKRDEVYAPNYNDGEPVALIRFPHGGTFEIAQLKVNNKFGPAKKLLGDVEDAIGIHPDVAQRLSGADFDGDTVIVIPNRGKKIKDSPALEGLKDFDPKTAYRAYDGMPKLKSDRKQQLMGDVSNLITDMTIKQAPHKDIVRAVRHSMVVIDAEKHHLDYKRSAIDNGIKQLKEQYQGGSRAGAATLISRKKSPVTLPEQKLRLQRHGGPIDPATGRRVYEPTGRTRINKAGERVLVEKRYNRLDLADDARTLMGKTPTPIERLYANHSNKLKALANEARLQSLKQPSVAWSPSAKKIHAKEVASLNSKLAIVNRNRPLERQAQVVANSIVAARRAANPDLDGDTLKKVKFQALADARARMKADKSEIIITQEEWNAIQAGAISNSKLNDILKKANPEVVKELATPKTSVLMTSAKTQRAKSMLAAGATRAEVARALGVSLTTLDTALS